MPVQPAYAEEVSEGNTSDENVRTKPGTKVSANIQKEEKKKSSKKQRSERKEKKTLHSDNGILKIEKGDGEETVADSLRVLSESKESRRRSLASAPVPGNRSPKKSSTRPIHARGRSVTFDSRLRHDKDDKRYSDRHINEDYTTTTNTSRQRQPPAQASPMRPDMRPSRPASHYGGFPPAVQNYPQAYPPMGYPSPAPVFSASPGQAPYGSYFPAAQPPSHLSERFGRTGNSTLAAAIAFAPSTQRSNEWRGHEEKDEEGGYDYELDDREEEKRLAAERRWKQKLVRDAREKQKLLEQGRLEDERQEEERLERLEQRARLERLERLEEQKRIEDSRKMPPPLGRPHRRDSELHYPPASPTFEDRREQNKRLSRETCPPRGSFKPERPSVMHWDTEPALPTRRPSTSRAAALASSARYAHDEPPRERRPGHRPNVHVSSTRDRGHSVYNGTSGTGTSTASSVLEERLQNAMGYQDDTSAAAAPNPLTAEALKRIGSGSRSTRSTASRDDSDVKRSVDTRTTRSGSGDGNDGLTFILEGTAQLKIGGAEVSTRDADGPVAFTIQNNGERPPRAIRNGSESGYAPSGISGSTAVSDRPKPNRRESMHSHRPRSSVDDTRYPPRVEHKHQNLMNRLNSIPTLGRTTSQRSNNHRDFVTDPGEWL